MTMAHKSMPTIAPNRKAGEGPDYLAVAAGVRAADQQSVSGRADDQSLSRKHGSRSRRGAPAADCDRAGPVSDYRPRDPGASPASDPRTWDLYRRVCLRGAIRGIARFARLVGLLCRSAWRKARRRCRSDRGGYGRSPLHGVAAFHRCAGGVGNDPAARPRAAWWCRKLYYYRRGDVGPGARRRPECREGHRLAWNGSLRRFCRRSTSRNGDSTEHMGSSRSGW